MKHNITTEGFEIFTCFVDCNLSSQVLVLNFKNCLIDAVTVLLLVMGSVFLNSLFTFFIIFIRKYHDWSNLSRGDNMAGTVTDFETHQGRRFQ